MRVDPIACKAHGVCIEMLPELIGRDPWGYPVIAERPVPAYLLGLAKRSKNPDAAVRRRLSQPCDVRAGRTRLVCTADAAAGCALRH